MNTDNQQPRPEPIRPIAHLGGLKPPSPRWFENSLACPSEEASVEVGGARIRYSAWGEVGKRGLLFIHGGRAHRNWWRPFAPFFADDHRVAALDLSGMGDSDWRPTYSIDQFVDEVFAVMEAADLCKGGRPLVVGHSFGGWVTLSAVERNGEKLAGAVVVDSHIGVPDPSEGYRIEHRPKESDAVSRANRVYDTIEEPITRFRFLPNQPCDQHYLVDYIAREGLMKAPLPPERGEGAGWTWKFDPQQGENFDIHFDRDLFLAARCPLAFIYGEKSVFTASDGFEHVKAQVKNRSPLVVMPDSHHHLMMEQPIAFVSTLRMLMSCWPIRVGS